MIDNLLEIILGFMRNGGIPVIGHLIVMTTSP